MKWKETHAFEFHPVAEDAHDFMNASTDFGMCGSSMLVLCGSKEHMEQA